MNIILFVITEDITNIQITVSVYVSRKLPTESAIPKQIWFNLVFCRFATINLGGPYDFFHFYPTC